jgi:signal transduction histidine kinase
MMDLLRSIPQPWSSVKTILNKDFRIGLAFFIPYEKTPVFPADIHTVVPLPIPDHPGDATAWHPEDVLILPLTDVNGEPLGMISVDDPRDGLRPDSQSLETLDIFASQASLVIASHQRIQSLNQEVGRLTESFLSSTSEAEALRSTCSSLQIKEKEHSLTILSFTQQISIQQALTALLKDIQKQKHRQEVLSALARSVSEHLPFEIAMIAEVNPDGIQMLEIIGTLPEGIKPEAYLGRRNPMHHAFRHRSVLFVPDVSKNDYWKDSPLIQGTGARGFIALPIPDSSKPDTVLLGLSCRELAGFETEMSQLFEILGQQVTLTLKTLELNEEVIRRKQEIELMADFNRQIISLKPAHLFQTLVDTVRKAVPAAHSAMVLQLDENGRRLVPSIGAGYSDPRQLLQLSFPLKKSLHGQVFCTKTALRKDEIDFVRDYHFSKGDLLRYRDLTEGRLPTSTLILPIMVMRPTYGKDDTPKLDGVLVLENYKSLAAFSREHEALVASLTQQTALTLENSRLLEETLGLTVDLERRVEERTKELAQEHHRTETLLQIITELSASLELEKVLYQTLCVLNDNIGASHATCMVLQPNDGKLRHLASIGYPNPTPSGGWPSVLTNDQGLVGWIISNRQSVLVKNVNKDDRWLQIEGAEHQHRSAMGVPIILGDQLLGVLLLFHPQVAHFSEDQLQLVNAAANQMAIAINNAELYHLIRNQAEELRILLKTQQVEASRSRSILEAIAEGVLVTDQSDLVTLYNDSAQRILDLDRGKVLGRSLNDLAGLFGSNTRNWIETIQTWSKNPNSFHDRESFSEQISLEDGRVLAVNLAPVFDKEEYFGSVSIFHDITHQIEVDRLKSEFVATVSHELRTPMTSIKGYVDILLMGVAGALTEQQQRFLQVVQQNTERLTILVNDLLDLSRIEAGKAVLSTRPLDLEFLIEEAISDIENRSREEEKPLTFSANIPKDLPKVLGDPERVRQILDNLLNNAYHYTPLQGKVIVTTLNIGNEVRVDISDTGIGIPLAEQERVFERFYRGDNSLVLATSGTGLGLSIVQQLIHMHHGRIWLRSSGISGEGSTFSFTLPTFNPSMQPTIEVEQWQEY